MIMQAALDYTSHDACGQQVGRSACLFLGPYAGICGDQTRVERSEVRRPLTSRASVTGARESAPYLLCRDSADILTLII